MSVSRSAAVSVCSAANRLRINRASRSCDFRSFHSSCASMYNLYSSSDTRPSLRFLFIPRRPENNYKNMFVF